MTTYTRLSVAGSNRRADVVVSSAEPLGSILPRLLELLDETGGTVARPLTFVTPDGEQLDVARSPQQLDLLDGTLLRLERLDAAPPPPVVIDVTDAAADAFEARPDRWGERSRAAAAAAGVALAAAVGGLLVPWGGPTPAVVGLIISIAVLLVIGAALGLGRLERISALLAAAASGLVLPLGIAVYSALSTAVPFGVVVYSPLQAEGAPAVALPTAVAAMLTALSAVVLVGVGVGLRRRGAVAGGAIGVVLGGLLLVLLLSGVDAAVSAGIAGTAAAFLTGLLPWVAMSTAGLTGLDQKVASGERLARPDALAAIDEAYAALTWSAAAVAVTLGVTGVILVADFDIWSGLLALAFALVAALRTRAFPLRAQGWLLWAAAAVIAASAVLILLPTVGNWWGVAAAVAGAAFVAVAALARPRPHTRARLRGLGNVVELLAVVALLPLVIGTMGVYGELLAMFGGGS